MWQLLILEQAEDCDSDPKLCPDRKDNSVRNKETKGQQIQADRSNVYHQQKKKQLLNQQHCIRSSQPIQLRLNQHHCRSVKIVDAISNPNTSKFLSPQYNIASLVGKTSTDSTLRGSLLLLGHPVATHNTGMVTLVGLQGHLLGSLELIRLELLHFSSKHGLSGQGGVNTIRLSKIFCSCLDQCRP